MFTYGNHLKLVKQQNQKLQKKMLFLKREKQIIKNLMKQKEQD